MASGAILAEERVEASGPSPVVEPAAQKAASIVVRGRMFMARRRAWALAAGIVTVPVALTWAVPATLRVVAAATTDVPPIPQVDGPYGGCADCSESARQIAWSLDNTPGEWSLEVYKRQHGRTAGGRTPVLMHGGRAAVWLKDPEHVQLGRTRDDVIKTDTIDQWQASPEDAGLIRSAAQRYLVSHHPEVLPELVVAGDEGFRP